MLTPQEAESHVFPKASFGGYNMLQVDAFLDSLIEDYRTLYQENASLKSKMKVLVEKVEEYRATEDAMRMTLHSAQKMADAMVKEGEAKKQAAIDQIAASVEEKSKAVRAEMAKEEQAVLAKLEQVKKDLANEQARLNAARASTTTYIGQLKDLYTAQIKYIGSLSGLNADGSKPAAPASKSDVGDTRVFDQVKFGKDYEIEQTTATAPRNLAGFPGRFCCRLGEIPSPHENIVYSPPPPAGGYENKE